MRYILKRNRINLKRNEKLKNDLLEPTKIYVKEVLKLNNKNLINGCANITGGGLTENIPRSIPNNLSSEIYLDNWKMPLFFRTLQKLGNVQTTDMLRIFNCGIGMTVVIEPEDVSATMKVLSKHKLKAYMIGKVIKKSSTRINFL